jgi:hyperosmotically inducible periplasmic protein
MAEDTMIRALLRVSLVVVIIAVVAAFLIGYRWGAPHRSVTTQPEARQESPVGTTGDRAEATREKARAAGAEIGEKVAAGAEKAGETLDEARLTAKVKSKIALDDTLDGSRISVATDDNRVTLTGTVISETQHRRALDLARETDGVVGVVDHLSVGTLASP